MNFNQRYMAHVKSLYPAICNKCNLPRKYEEYTNHAYARCIKCCKDDLIEKKKKQDARRQKRMAMKRRKNFNNAHRIHINAINHGILKRPDSCSECKKKYPQNDNRRNKIHAHHDDYLKPLDVRWLCIYCHKKWHVINGPGKNAG